MNTVRLLRLPLVAIASALIAFSLVGDAFPAGVLSLAVYAVLVPPMLLAEGRLDVAVWRKWKLKDDPKSELNTRANDMIRVAVRMVVYIGLSGLVFFAVGSLLPSVIALKFGIFTALQLGFLPVMIPGVLLGLIPAVDTTSRARQ